MTENKKTLKFYISGLLCLLLIFSCFAFSGCEDDKSSHINRVGCPDIKFTIVESDDIIFTGYNILSITTEYEEGDKTWDVYMFDGESWHTETAGIPPNRWYIKLTLDNEISEKINTYSLKINTNQRLRIKGKRDYFSFTTDFLKHNTDNSWIIRRGSSEENALNFANFLLGNISTSDYEAML